MVIRKERNPRAPAQCRNGTLTPAHPRPYPHPVGVWAFQRWAAMAGLPWQVTPFVGTIRSALDRR
jgi:hypothetical protein